MQFASDRQLHTVDVAERTQNCGTSSPAGRAAARQVNARLHRTSTAELDLRPTLLDPVEASCGYPASSQGRRVTSAINSSGSRPPPPLFVAAGGPRLTEEMSDQRSSCASRASPPPWGWGVASEAIRYPCRLLGSVAEPLETVSVSQEVSPLGAVPAPLRLPVAAERYCCSPAWIRGVFPPFALS